MKSNLSFCSGLWTVQDRRKTPDKHDGKKTSCHWEQALTFWYSKCSKIVLALVIWVATVTSRGHPEKTFSKIIPRFSAKIFLKIAPALANHGHSRYELLHLNPWRQGHKDLWDCVWTTNLERRTLLQWKDARSQNILWLYTYDFCKSSALTFGMQFDAIEIEDARFWGKWGT